MANNERSLDTVRVGLIGAGRIAKVHAAAYDRIARGSIVAVTDPVIEAAQAMSKEHGYALAPSFTDLLHDDSIDAVLLATPNFLHADQTIQALEAGKHVFCQKPISLTLEDANRVVAAAAASDRILQFGFMLRFTPPIPQLQQRIERGELGPLIAAQAAVFGWEPSSDWFYDPKNGGGVILDTLVHFGDLVLWLFGPAERVTTEGGAYKLEGAKRFGSPDNAVVTIRHKSGVVSSMYVSWTAGRGNFTLDVFGNDGSATVDLVHSQALNLFIADKGREDAGWQYPDLVWDYGYAGEQQYFVDHILGRVDGARAGTAGQARDALALMLAAQESLDVGHTVELDR
ncbi:MAG: Myo-inositol 2-dehydrogenase / D-chiro-inositol 1-dehydrogenase [Glaciihabitans sp.]|jgi:myo-inositol 2-dehydrogenase/D-chiro-inositol 1-dehydrogenase|nr:Myo-inositol 2-dehydrogenase / D-chiro-inositol 1-dehydrogenase [Glaciihabitans sp.]MDQ1571282.1 myo-inositol 2-dehydrogenase / D-chiro-inositol 1-dehydrogenase [Actinomycetota bacterium]